MAGNDEKNGGYDTGKGGDQRRNPNPDPCQENGKPDHVSDPLHPFVLYGFDITGLF